MEKKEEVVTTVETTTLPTTTPLPGKQDYEMRVEMEGWVPKIKKGLKII